MNRPKVAWQPPAHYRIVALNPTLEPHVRSLENALDGEIQIAMDIKREDFLPPPQNLWAVQRPVRT